MCENDGRQAKQVHDKLCDDYYVVTVSIMRPILFLCLLFIFMPIAGRAACGRDFATPNITVNIVPWQVREDRSRTQEQLTPMASRQSWLTPGHSARGIYNAALMHRVNIDFVEQDGGFAKGPCVGIKSLNVDLSFQNPTLYLAQELAWASCVANAVREHEKKHAAMDVQVLSEFAPALNADMVRWVDVHRPVEASSGDEAKTIWQNNLQDYLKSQLQIFTNSRNRRQQGIDTPEEYQRIASACPQN
jgi:hypothetical protein